MTRELRRIAGPEAQSMESLASELWKECWMQKEQQLTKSDIVRLPATELLVASF
jgi:hypothetical protein